MACWALSMKPLTLMISVCQPWMLQVIRSEGASAAHPSADGGGEATAVEAQMARVIQALLARMAEWALGFGCPLDAEALRFGVYCDRAILQDCRVALMVWQRFVEREVKTCLICYRDSPVEARILSPSPMLTRDLAASCSTILSAGH